MTIDNNVDTELNKTAESPNTKRTIILTIAIVVFIVAAGFIVESLYPSEGIIVAPGVGAFIQEWTLL